MGRIGVQLELGHLVRRHTNLKAIFLRKHPIDILHLFFMPIGKSIKAQLSLILDSLQTEIGIHFRNKRRLAVLDKHGIGEYHLTPLNSLRVRQQVLDEPGEIFSETAILFVILFSFQNGQAQLQLFWHLVKVAELLLFLRLMLTNGTLPTHLPHRIIRHLVHQIVKIAIRVHVQERNARVSMLIRRPPDPRVMSTDFAQTLGRVDDRRVLLVIWDAIHISLRHSQKVLRRRRLRSLRALGESQFRLVLVVQIPLHLRLLLLRPLFILAANSEILNNLLHPAIVFALVNILIEIFR